MLSTLLEATGFCLVVAGVFLIWLPAALIVAGSGLVLAALALERR